MQGVALTDEQLRMAAEARYMGRASWEDTAKAAGCVSATIRQYEYDADPRWLAAIAAVVKIMRQRGLPVAYTCLLEQAESGDVAAAKELLNRCEGAVTQTLGLHGVDGKPPIEFSWWRGIEAAQQQSGDVQEETDGSGSGEG